MITLTTGMKAGTDNRPPIYPSTLDKQEFSKAGLWFAISLSPPNNIWVNYIKGDDHGPYKRSFVGIGKLGEKLPIYCVNAPTERDDTLIVEAFLEGYKAGLQQ
jgi:hypothetical protein